MSDARGFMWLVTLSALGALAAAFTLQWGFGFRPCHLCVLQRWPWAGVAAIGTLALAFRRPRPGLVLALLTLLAAVGVAMWHVGVEQGWFALPGGCQALPPAETVEDLRARIADAAPTCDQVHASFAGLSLATWSLLLGLGVTLLALAGLLRRRSASAAAGR